MLRKVEFVGLPSPLADPAIQQMIARGTIHPADLKRLDRMETDRQWHGWDRTAGITRRIIGPEHGFTRAYVFGFHDYVQLMEAEDVARLMAADPLNRRAFRVLDELDLPTRIVSARASGAA